MVVVSCSVHMEASTKSRASASCGHQSARKVEIIRAVESSKSAIAEEFSVA